MAVLVGYAVALGGTASGHGLRLAVHLLAEHHEAHGEQDEAHGEHNEHREARDEHREHPEHAVADEEAHGVHAEGRREPHDGHSGAAEDTHSHHGQLHAHREAPPVPALVSVELDKHCVFDRPRPRAPGDARRLDWPSRAETPDPVVRAVEVRPPQSAA